MKKIIITGGSGFIASLVAEKLKASYEVVALTRHDVDLGNTQQVKEYFDAAVFDYVFHTGAMAQTADCENFPELTHRINVDSTKVISDICNKKNARLIFISTEQVFNAKTSKGPFLENESPSAITTYGNHKIECEEYITSHANNYLILRFSWMFGMSRPGIKASPNIIKNVMKALFYQTPTKFTVNEIRGMTYAQTFANQFEKILQLETGIYHISDVSTHNTYESACIVADKLGFEKQSIEQYILPDTDRYADRFRDYRLDPTKLNNLGITFGSFEENIDDCLKDFGWIK